jgi:hypothetical protein
MKVSILDHWTCWLMARRRAAREGLDDDHAAAATWTCRLVVIRSMGIGRFALRLWPSEQFADARDVVRRRRVRFQPRQALGCCWSGSPPHFWIGRTSRRPLLERALAIYEQALGPEHPDTNRMRCNLARLLIA